MEFWRVLFLIGVALLTQACSLRLIESYDPELEKGIAEYHSATVEYLSKIKQNAGAQENSYSSAISQEFYAASSAKLSSLVVRAETSTGPRCIPQQLGFLEAHLKALPPAVADLLPPTPSELDLSGRTCTAVALRVLQGDQKIMQRMHERSGRMGTFRAQLWSDLTEDAARIALTIVKSTKL
jgi:hypothetical protein